MKAATSITKGVRPERPSRETNCRLEPADDVWDVISSCWQHDASTRPHMTGVCDLLKKTQLPEESRLGLSKQGGLQKAPKYESVQFRTSQPLANGR
jgi:hypothetical protein